MINNRQAGRRRGRGGQQRQGGGGNGRGPESGNRIDNRARGNANQLLEKYKNLAADAQRQGDRVNTEYYLQFADHYFRVLADSRSRFEEQNPRRQAEDGYDDEDEGDIDGFDTQPQAQPRRTDNRERQDRERQDRDRQDRPERQDRERADRGDREDAPRDRQMRDDGRGERQSRDDGRGERQPRADRLREDRGFEPRGGGERVREERAQPSRASEAAPADLPREDEASSRPARSLRPRRTAAPMRDAEPADAADEPVMLDLAVLPPPIQLGVEGEAGSEDGAPPAPRRRGRPRKADAAAEQAAE